MASPAGGWVSQLPKAALMPGIYLAGAGGPQMVKASGLVSGSPRIALGVRHTTLIERVCPTIAADDAPVSAVSAAAAVLAEGAISSSRAATSRYCPSGTYSL